MDTRLYQIEDARNEGSFLGPMGWARNRTSALTFLSDRAAREWIDSINLVSPALMSGRQPNIVPSPEVLDLPTRPIASDFDPYREAR